MKIILVLACSTIIFSASALLRDAIASYTLCSRLANYRVEIMGTHRTLTLTLGLFTTQVSNLFANYPLSVVRPSSVV